ncbi:MAG: hypothetical protein HZB43_11055 [candidate division Zixibacteria bacterium]|nr:hypothetical protein [candidate division Zixibacteria bacterium]
MLTGIHFLLTYTCTSECDHCFLYCSPDAQGTFTKSRIADALDQAAQISSVRWAYFEGGEPFLFYPLMLDGIRMARDHGFQTGIVTNSYWATSMENALLWLEPLRDLGVADLSLSDDALHYGAGSDTPAKIALAAAQKLGIPASPICITAPEATSEADDPGVKGAPVTGGSVRFRGRAAEKLTSGQPRLPWQEFRECTHEELQSPERVHVDPFGNVHICQGLLMGNMWEVPLAKLIAEYEADRHPICGPLLRGGPAELARFHGVIPQNGYIDECHLCWETRRTLMEQFPQYLAPKLVYGIAE